MADSALKEILHKCLSLEKCAIRFYQRLSKATNDTMLTRFWEDMARQESEHVHYWKKLLSLTGKDKIRNIFDDPKRIIKELENIRHHIDTLFDSDDDLSDCTTAFMIAYRLEFYMMHPAFEALFHLMREETGDTSPEDSYQNHIRGLLNTMKKCKPRFTEFQLISELMERLWDRNKELAVQLSDIRTLRGFIPICMHCKNIRNDKGYWEKVEQYIESHAIVQFSHGICPDCMVKYYSEYSEPENKNK